MEALGHGGGILHGARMSGAGGAGSSVWQRCAYGGQGVRVREAGAEANGRRKMRNQRKVDVV